MIAKTSKPPLCRHCKVRMPDATQPIHDECVSPWWAKERARKERNAANKAKREAVADRVATRQKLDKLKSRSQWAKEAQAAVNKFIRLRDADLPCISCGRFHQGAHDAGHYLSVGARPELRFDELNIHKQCVPCNQHKSGNVVLYRINLLEKIGAEAVAYLEGPHDPKKYTVEELKAIKTTYTAKARAIEKERV